MRGERRDAELKCKVRPSRRGRCWRTTDLLVGTDRGVRRGARMVATMPIFVGRLPRDTNTGKETLKTRLDNLLQELPSAMKRVTGGFFDALKELPGSTKNAVDQGSLQPLANWWDTHRSAVADERERMRTQGSHPGLVLRPAGLLQKVPWWKRNRGAGKNSNGRKDKKREEENEINVGGLLVGIGRFLIESINPWDFDRRELALALVQKWEDWEVLHGQGTRKTRGGRDRSIRDGNKDDGKDAEGVAAVKVTSTMMPLKGEWKVSGRTPLWRSANWGGVVFAKAGLFLAGERVPYVGLEADRVWRRPNTVGNQKHIAPFVNLSYRSSRLPEFPVIRLSTGVQFGLQIGGLPLTVRFGLRPLETRRNLFLLPVSNDRYF